MMTKQKSISEMLAVIILLALVVVAGAFVYNVFFGRANTLTSNPSIQITSASLQGGVLTITVKNTGTVAFSTITVELYEAGGSPVNPATSSGSSSPQWTIPISTNGGQLAPGQTASWSEPYGSNVQSGNTYTVVVTAQTSSGQQVSTSTQVIAQ